jgi:hypothetical protein
MRMPDRALLIRKPATPSNALRQLIPPHYSEETDIRSRAGDIKVATNIMIDARIQFMTFNGMNINRYAFPQMTTDPWSGVNGSQALAQNVGF